MGLHQKILAIMNDVSYLQKDDNVRYGKTNYKAISEEKVTGAVRGAMIKHKVIILPVEQEHLRDDRVVDEKIHRLTTVNTKYKIIDTESGEHEIIVSSGTGVDTQDKGVGKAMTYSFKYLLLRTFAIPTGEDPDKVSSEELDDKLTPKKDVTKIKNRISNGFKRLGANEKEIRLISEEFCKTADYNNCNDKDRLGALLLHLLDRAKGE